MIVINKQLLPSILIWLLVVHTPFVISLNVPQAAIKEYTFSLSNTNAQPIWIALFENEELVIPVTKVEPTAYDNHPLITAIPDIRKSIMLAVWHDDPGQTSPRRNAKDVIPIPDHRYTFTPGKTLYLAWHSLEQLNPQTGMFWGLMPESREGFNLELNVDPSDVILIEE